MPSKDQAATIPSSRTADWISTATQERGVSQYLEAIWSGRWIVLVAVIAALAGAFLYVTTATKVYQAHSQLLVTPLPTASGTSGLGLVQQSADPLRDVETFSGFVTATTVAERVRSSAGLHQTAQQLVHKITVTPIAESDIVDIAANAGSPAAAQKLADAFATATVQDRSSILHSELGLLIPRLRAQVSALGSGSGAARAPLEAQLAEEETLAQGPDPTLRVEALADRPTSPISPRKTLTLVAGLFGGLVLGVGLVFLLQLLDPRLRSEEELRDRFRLPVLARVPKLSWRARTRRRRGPMPPGAVSPEATDAYRTLRSVLNSTRQHTSGARTVLVTGASPLDGKTTTAINLSSALAAFGERVMLIEGDLRRPSIGAALNIAAPEGVQSVLYDHFTLEEALIDTVVPSQGHAHLRLLLANANGGSPQPLSPPALRGLLGAASSISDWVVIDAPPLIYAPDLLSASELLDVVVLAVRLGNTNLSNLEETAEILAHHGIRPAGFVVIGTSGHPEYY